MTILRRIFSVIVPNRKRAAAFVLVAGVFLVMVVLLVPRPAEAGWVINSVTEVLDKIMLSIVGMLARLLVSVTNIMVAVAQYNDFINATAVDRGWVIVRDITNMFFILVLLVIAFGTILKLEEYRYNRLLGRLILMAFLVNFSRFIAGFFIDIGQVIMLTFVNAFRDIAAGNLTSAFGLENLVAIVSKDELPKGELLLEVHNALILAIFMLLIALVTVLLITIIFIYRILVLWFLIILSPLAFLLRTFPAWQKYGLQWWEYFGRYVTVGPVLAFFLWLSLAVSSQTGDRELRVTQAAHELIPKGTRAAQELPGGEDSLLGRSERFVAGGLNATINQVSSSENLLSFGVTVGLLIGSLMVASRWGVAGGKLAGEWSGKLGRGFGRGLAIATLQGLALTAAIRGGRLAGRGAVGAGKGAIELAKLPPKGLASLAKGWGEGKIAQWTGINVKNFTPERLKQAWEAGVKARQAKRAETARERAERIEGVAGEFIRSPQNFFVNYWNGVTWGRLRKGELDISGKKGKELKQSIDGYEQESKQREQAVENAQENDEEAKQQKKKRDIEQEQDELKKRLGDPVLSSDEWEKAKQALVNLTKESSELNDKIVAESDSKKRQGLIAQRDALIAQRTLQEPKVGDPNIKKEDREKLQAKYVDTVKRLHTVDANLAALDPQQVAAQKAAVAKARQEKADFEKTHSAQYQQNLEAYKRIRPTVDFTTRVEVRSDVGEVKKTITTENWKEIRDIMDDALRSGDWRKFAAGMVKATEDRNLNEILNSFGHSASAQGLKAFTQEFLIGRLGMSKDSAHTIANDASHVAEKVGHWTYARAFTSKNGVLDFQAEEDRQKEVYAEMRKIDPETRYRQLNRLGFFSEHIKPPDTFTEEEKKRWEREDDPEVAAERARHFRQTEQRYSRPHPYGISLFFDDSQNFEGQLLGRNRVSKNLLAHMADNLPEYKKMAGLLDPDKAQVVAGAIDATERYGKIVTSAQGQFDTLNRIQKAVAHGVPPPAAPPSPPAAPPSPPPASRTPPTPGGAPAGAAPQGTQPGRSSPFNPFNP